MLSVRVAAAVARALPRRAGLVSAGHQRVEGGPAATAVSWSRCDSLEALSARRVRGCGGRRHLALLAAPAWPHRAGRAEEGPLRSSSVRDGTKRCGKDGDLDVVQRWGLRRISVFS